MTHEYVTAKRPALDIPLVTRELQRLGCNIPTPTYLESTASTQPIAIGILHAGTAAPFVVLADEQTAGRGRLDRQWVTPPRTGVLMSIALPVADATALPLRVGAAVLSVLQRYAPELALKWPNDIVFVGPASLRKLGGMIAELVPVQQAVVVGIGINVDLQPDELPTPEALSLAQLGNVPRRETLVAELVAACLRLSAYDLEDYRRNCCTIGSDVAVARLGAEPLRGRAVGIDADGSLLVENTDGLHTVSGGDVLHVRPGEDA